VKKRKHTSRSFVAAISCLHQTNPRLARVPHEAESAAPQPRCPCRGCAISLYTPRLRTFSDLRGVERMMGRGRKTAEGGTGRDFEKTRCTGARMVFGAKNGPVISRASHILFQGCWVQSDTLAALEYSNVDR